MGFPYSKRIKVKVVVEGNNNCAVKLVEGTVVFEGTPKHCWEQLIRWGYQKGYVDVGDLFQLMMLLNLQEFGAERKRAQAFVRGLSDSLGEPKPAQYIQ